jgi:hypothetical protein
MSIAVSRTSPPPLELLVSERGESAVLLVRQPTYQDLIRNDAFKLEEDWQGYHEWLIAHLVGWRGFATPEGADLTFSPAAVLLVLGQLPDVYAKLRDYVFGMYHRSKEADDEGKAPFNAPSPPSSAENVSSIPP